MDIHEFLNILENSNPDSFVKIISNYYDEDKKMWCKEENAYVSEDTYFSPRGQTFILECDKNSTMTVKDLINHIKKFVDCNVLDISEETINLVFIYDRHKMVVPVEEVVIVETRDVQICRTIISTQIYLLVHKDGTNVIESGYVYKAQKEIDQLHSTYNLHIGGKNYCIHTNELNSRISKNDELIYFGSSIIILISDAITPTDDEIKALFLRMKKECEQQGWVLEENEME